MFVHQLGVRVRVATRKNTCVISCDIVLGVTIGN